MRPESRSRKACLTLIRSFPSPSGAIVSNAAQAGEREVISQDTGVISCGAVK